MAVATMTAARVCEILGPNHRHRQGCRDAGSETRVSDLDKASVIIPLDTHGRRLPPRSRELLLAETASNPLAGVGLPIALGGAELGAAELGG